MMKWLVVFVVMLVEFAILDSIFMFVYCKKNHLKFKAKYILRNVGLTVFFAFGMTFAAWLVNR